MSTSSFCALIDMPERTWRRWQAKARAEQPPKGPWPQPAREAARDLVTKHALKKPDTEQFGDLGGAVLTAVHQRDQVSLLPTVQLGLLAAQVAFGSGHLHAFPRPQADEVRLEFGHHRQHVEQQPTHRVGLMNRANPEPNRRRVTTRSPRFAIIDI